MTVLTVALALAGAGCTREPDVEKVAVGSDVQLTRQDGGVVQGKLTAKDEKTVQVQSGKTTKTVPKDQIADVKVVAKDAPTPPKLPPVAKFREITVPEGTKLAVELETPLNTKTATIEQPVEGRLTEAVTIDGTEVLPVGSKIHGNVSPSPPRQSEGRGEHHRAVQSPERARELQISRTSPSPRPAARRMPPRSASARRPAR
jgi:hypothetical protein